MHLIYEVDSRYNAYLSSCCQAADTIHHTCLDVDAQEHTVLIYPPKNDMLQDSILEVLREDIICGSCTSKPG